MKTLGLIFGTIVLFLSTSFADTTFTIGAGTGPEADMTYMNQAATSTNYGTGVTAFVYDSVGGGANTAILIRWDALADSLNHGGANLYIKSLKIKLKSNLQASDRSTTGILCVARCRRGTTTSAKWTEANASWLDYKNLGSWSTAGARNVSNDIDTTVMVRFDWSVVSFNSDSTVELDITTVGQTIDAADTAKCHGGVVLFSPWWGSSTAWNKIHEFYTDDNGTTANRPTLTAIYTKAVQPVASSNNLRRRTANVRHSFSYKEKIRAYYITG